MRSKTHLWKRSLSAFLSLVMVLAMVPALDVVPEAEAATQTVDNGTQGEGYISLPITIRDFPADGMLFENNEYANSGSVTLGATTELTIAATNPSYTTWINNLDAGVYIVTYDGMTQTGPWGAGLYAHMAICDANGNIKKVLGYGEAKGTYTSTKAEMQSGWYVVWCFNSAPGYATLSAITSTNMSNYKLTYSGSTLTVSDVGNESGTYHYGNTVGFGLTATNTHTHDQLLTPPDQTIAGTEYIMYGSYNYSPDKMTENGFTGTYYTLNSGATQWVHGALIRTNLVESKLDVNKNLIYTQATVDYLAAYMEATLTEVWQNSDGSYNLWYVMGDKLFNDNNEYVGKGSSSATRDLPAVLRSQITGMGTYDESKDDYASGALASIQDIDSYYDAAYFLLHKTFDDAEGYGMTAEQYSEVRLVQKTKDDGSVYYLFNSAFNDTEYNYTDGYIVNTQTTEVDDRADIVDGSAYTRGNIQAMNRFDPLGPSGAGEELGYGMSGSVYNDLYAELGNDGAVNDQTMFYDTTNYNLSLEGHAQFIYYEDDELYFTFTGDDDVYLYINGVRVLDVGGAHAIGKVTIKLNDVAELCGLRDGQPYDFDFYYMERHGTAANFGIETNIKIVDPSMTTNKTGYQNGASTGYNGFVDPNKSVAYSFELQNKGEADLINLTFDDDDIGVYFGYDNITLNDDSDINEMYLYRYNSNGTVKNFYAAGQLTEKILQDELAKGLVVGEKIGIYGFRYKIPETKWVDNTFTNTVYTTGVADADNVDERTLNGIADWKVQKSTLTTQPFHVYDWVTKDVSQNPDTVCNWYSPEGATVTVTKEELVQPVKDAGHEVPANVTIALCSASGNEGGVNINPNATLNDDGSITYTSTKPGQDTVYYKIKGMSYDTMVFHYDVYTYGTVNNVYVLDYGLAVELNGDDFGFRVNDTLELTQNQFGTTATVTDVVSATSNYGDFAWESPSLKYTPKDIIDGTDSVQANIQILEDGKTSVTKFTGVDMYETVTTAPANVVYYEENHPGITYVNEGENQWAHYETVDEEGNSTAGTEQSANQDSNYGSDPNYAVDKEGAYDTGAPVIDSTTLNLDTTDLDALQASGIEFLNEYLGLGGSDSNGTVNQLVVNKTADVMFFDFVGTGFEIVSRTTDEQYAVINVQVQKDTDGDGEYETVVTQKPVITESKGGDLYQVPIISITGLEKAEYRVVVKAAGSTANKTRVLYIDGIRIYGPLSDDEALEYYNPEEYQAEFFEIKQLIQNGQMIYADASETDNVLELVTGTTLVEDVNADGVLTAIESVDDYMQVGPNNEIYLDGNNSNGMIAFFLIPDASTPEGARTIEIGAHRKSDSYWEDDGDVTMTYGSTADDITEGTNHYVIGSGTEMYYTIDVNNLTLDDSGRYLVMIGTNGSEYDGTTLALTSIKISGYEISFAQTAVVEAYNEGDVLGTPIVSEPFALLRARRAAAEEEPEVDTTPVNENLTINSAALKAAKVVSGKVATLNVKASSEAAAIVVTDAEGNVVEATRLTTKVSGDTVAFNFIWKVYGSRGDTLDYTIRVYDENGLASVNTETVTVTIK